MCLGIRRVETLCYVESQDDVLLLGSIESLLLDLFADEFQSQSHLVDDGFRKTYHSSLDLLYWYAS